jgi:hypothetical protein
MCRLAVSANQCVPLSALLVGSYPLFDSIEGAEWTAMHVCRLAVSTNQYVPLSAPLLEMLGWACTWDPEKVG